MTNRDNDQSDVPEAEDHNEVVFSETPLDQTHHKLEYTGTWNKIMALAMWNALWTILTLGIFRFWAKTRVRRYVWSHTRIDGDGLEYTGRGLELFLGFVIVALCAGPFIALFVYARMQVPVGNVGINFAIDLAIWIPLIFLMHIAMYRAQRYRLSRTSWRGIRGHLGGSSLKYAGNALVSLFFTSLTLGICKPYYDIELMKYERNHTMLGDAKMAFGGMFTPAFKKWLVIWFILLLTYLVTFGLFVALVKVLLPLAIVIGLVGAGFGAYQLARYQAWFFRYTTGETSLGNLAFSSELTPKKLFKIYAVLLISLVVLFALIVMIFSMVIGASIAASGNAGPNMPFVFAMTFLFLVLLGPVQQIVLLPMFVQPLIAAKVSSITMTGEIDRFTVQQVARSEPKTGEGLAEAFDLGGI